MKSILMLIVVAFAACVSSVPPAAKAPATPTRVEAGRGSGTGCSIIECGENGTQLTGLSVGDRSGAVHAVTLPSGEIGSLP
jgi:hypothetical protein